MWEPNIKFDNNNNNNNNNNVGGLVGGCGARAVSRKTPIFFIGFEGSKHAFGPKDSLQKIAFES